MIPTCRVLASISRPLALLCCLALAMLVQPAGALAFVPRPLPGRLLVKLHDGVPLAPSAGKAGQLPLTGVPRLDALGAQLGLRSFASQFPGETAASKALAGHDLSRYFVLDFPPGVDLESLLRAYAAEPAVESVELDMLMPVDICVNDAAQQWHIESPQGRDAHATGGWNHSQGDSSVILAIADTGVDWQHPDLGGSGPNYLNGNIWVNWTEWWGTPGLDDDGNGKVDDVRGWDFVTSLGSGWPGEDAAFEDNDPRDFNGHGTHVAGIASARTNNGIGVAGVGFRCKVMALRIGGSIDDNGSEQGVVLMSAAAAAIDYARQKGAVAVNCSWGSSNYSGLGAAVSSAVAAGMVIVVAAGNDNSAGPSYLGSRGDCFDVAASDNSDHKADFSNFGTWVDITAPGVGIYSTYFDHNQPPGPTQHTYAGLQGTSMAAPVVTGLVGLVKSHWPGYTRTAVISAIQQGANSLDALNPAYAGLLGAGRVNVLRTFNDRFLSVPDDYCSFEVALAASGDGDTLALQGGLVLNTHFYMQKNKRVILGGWNAGFTVRDPVQNPTIVQPLTGGPALEVGASVDSTLTLDGFRFLNGTARALSSPLVGMYGGGVLCLGGSPRLRYCRFESSSAGDGSTAGGGGGGFFANSSARLVGCVFQGNSAGAGGGLYAYQSNLTLQDCSFASNTLFRTPAGVQGAGLYAEGGSLVLAYVTISNNSGADEGGAMYARSVVVSGTGVLATGNSAASQGGGFRLDGGASLVLRASDLRGGSAAFGAGISAATGTMLDLSGCVVAGNTAQILGGGVYAQGAGASFRNVTFDANRATLGGGDALFASSCTTPWVLHNCLVSNHPSTVNAACTFSGSAPQLDYGIFWSNGVNVGGGSLGAHDAIADPLYVNQAVGDLALALHSPALDSGDPAPQYLDPDGSRCDRGAYGGPESASRAPAPPTGLAASRRSNPARNELHWTANPEPDVKLYAVYRGATSSFTPSAASCIGTVPAGTTQLTDAAGGPGDWYRIAAADSSGASSGFSAAVQPIPTDSPPPLPQRFALRQNVPNPFNPSTLVGFDLPAGSRVRLDIYDASGRRVRRLDRGWMDAGVHQVGWDGTDDGGNPAASGMYVYRLQAGSWGASKKMILAR